MVSDTATVPAETSLPFPTFSVDDPTHVQRRRRKEDGVAVHWQVNELFRNGVERELTSPPSAPHCPSQFRPMTLKVFDRSRRPCSPTRRARGRCAARRHVVPHRGGRDDPVPFAELTDAVVAEAPRLAQRVHHDSVVPGVEDRHAGRSRSRPPAAGNRGGTGRGRPCPCTGTFPRCTGACRTRRWRPRGSNRRRRPQGRRGPPPSSTPRRGTPRTLHSRSRACRSRWRRTRCVPSSLVTKLVE